MRFDLPTDLLPMCASGDAVGERTRRAYRLGMLGMYARARHQLGALTRKPLSPRDLGLVQFCNGLVARAEGAHGEASRALSRAAECFKEIAQPKLSELSVILAVHSALSRGNRDWASNIAADASDDSRIVNLPLAAAEGDYEAVLSSTDAIISDQTLPHLYRVWAALSRCEAEMQRGHEERARIQLASTIGTVARDGVFGEHLVKALVMMAECSIVRYIRRTEKREQRNVHRREATEALRVARTYSTNMDAYRIYVDALTCVMKTADSAPHLFPFQEVAGFLERLHELGDWDAEYRLCRLGLRLARELQEEELAQWEQAHRVAKARLGLTNARNGSTASNLGVSSKGHPRAVATILNATIDVGNLRGGNAREVELRTVFEVNRLIASERRLDHLLPSVLREVVRLLGAERGAIVEKRGDEYIVLSEHSAAAKLSLHEAQPFSRSVVEATLASGTPVLSNNVNKDKRFQAGRSILGSELRSALCAPISRGSMRGVIYIDASALGSVFTDVQRDLLEVFATQAAIAIENANAFESIETINRGLETTVAERTKQLRDANDDLSAKLTEIRETKLKLIQSQKETLEAEMRIATDIQNRMLPPVEEFCHARTRVLGQVRAASAVAGDFWYVRPLEDGRLLVLISDVTGHGVGAGMVTAIVRSCIETLLLSSSYVDLPTTFGTMSRLVQSLGGGELMMTAFGCEVSPEANAFRWIAAAHPPAVLLVPGKGPQLLGEASTPLGAVGVEPDWVCRELSAPPAGSQLLLCTDGVLEQESERGRQFGQKGWVRMLKRLAHQPLPQLLDGIYNEIDRFRGNEEQADDITVVGLQFDG